MTSGLIAIANEFLEADIAPLGAELFSLRDAAGREMMTDADPRWWTGRAPLLFPIVGRLAGDRYRLGAAEYALPLKWRHVRRCRVSRKSTHHRHTGYAAKCG